MMKESTNDINTIPNRESVDSTIFKSLFENSLSGILYGNPLDGSVYDANPAAAIMFGYTVDELRKLNRNDIFDFSHPSMIESLKTRQNNGEAKGELIGIRKNGEHFPIEFTSSVFVLENGEQRTTTILNDITERKEAEEEINLFLNNTEETFVFIDTKFKIIYFNKRFSDGYFLNYKKKVTKGESIFNYAEPDKKEAIMLIFNKVLSGECHEDTIERTLPNGKSLFFRVLYKPSFDFLKNANGIFISTIDVTEQKVTENEMKLLLDNTEESFVLVNKQFEVVSFNQRFKSNCQYYFESNIIKGDCILKFVPEEDRSAVENRYIHVFKGETVESIISAPNQNNSITYFRARYKPAFDNSGIIMGAFVTLSDITAKRKAIEEKEFEQRNKEALINTTIDLIWSVDRKFNLIAANKAFFNTMKIVLGKDLNSGDNLIFTENVDLEFVSFWEQMYLRGFTGESFKFETVSPSRYENVVYLDTTIHPMFEGKDVVGLACYSRDITEIKLAHLQLEKTEQEIKKSHEQLTKLTESVDTVVFQFEMTTDNKMSFPFISKSLSNLNPGIDIELLKQDATAAFAFVHPDDINGLIKSIYESRDSLVNWNYEFRSIIDDKKEIWIKGASRPELKDNGTVVWYGYFLDVTDRNVAQENLKKANERYDIIAKASNDTIWDVDVINNSITWSEGIKQVYGYTNDEPNINSADWWYSKIHPDDIENVKKQNDLWFKQKHIKLDLEYRFLCADNTYKYVFDRGFMVVEDSIPMRMIGVMQDVTVMKEDEKKLEKILGLLKQTNALAKICGWEVDLVNNIHYWSPEIYSILGIDVSIKPTIDEVIPFVAPKHQSIIKKAIYNALHKGSAWDLELEANTAKGRTIWLRVQGTCFREKSKTIKLLGTIQDITERKTIEEQLRDTDLKFKTIIDTAPECIKLISKSGELMMINKSGLDMLEIESSEVLKEKPLDSFVVPTYRAENNKLFENGINGIPGTLEFELITVKGNRIWVDANAVPIENSQGEVYAILVITRDITQKKNDDLEREHIIAELSQNNKDLKQFSYVTSHNLRAPIANLLGLTSLIDQYKVPNKSLKQILDGIRQSALMFDDTVKDLAKVLVIKDQTNIVKEKVSFVGVIDNILKQLSITMEDNTVKINYEFADAPFVSFNPAYLESILLNLFTNAIKYKSFKRNLKIEINSSLADGFVILKFKDNGIGIDTEKHKDKLFKLYQRFHDNPDGKGLGLYLVKSQLESLGGSIAIESEVDKGTTFIIKFKN